ncbi:MAG: BON domain-containing protein [Actinobacteria bacterium]|nr:MAG: BON domain-containing protein [Actinomycetota bacterium]
MGKNNESNKRFLTALWAFLAGIVITILTTPKSGKSTRNWIGNQAKHARHLGKRTIRRAGSKIRYFAGYAKGSFSKASEFLNPTVEFADDDLITDRVKTELGENPLTWDLPERLNINCENGIVIIRGPVENWQQKQDVEDVIKQVEGVVGLVNDLRIVA